MTRQAFIITDDIQRQKAIAAIKALPIGARVEAVASKRTLPQNARFWAQLTDVSEQLVWHGRTLTPDQWKEVFMAALEDELRSMPDLVPGIDGRSLVKLESRSSKLTKDEMGGLMEIITAFGVAHGVQFHDDFMAGRDVA